MRYLTKTWKIAVPDVAEATVKKVTANSDRKMTIRQPQAGWASLNATLATTMHLMTALTAMVQTQQPETHRLRHGKPKAIGSNLLARLYPSVRDVESQEESKVTTSQEKKISKNDLHVTSSKSESDHNNSDKPRNTQLRSKREKLRIIGSGLYLHLNVTELKRIAVSSIAGWVK